jgi:signal transduction histidine kinase
MDLGTLCREVLDEMRAAHGACAVHFEPQGDLTGEWDGARLRQLVSNLLGNAIQHGGANCRVDLWARGDGPDVVLAVRNEGPPIPRDALATIFDPLARGTSPEMQKRRRPGSIGLGLYIAHEVVTAHGGAIDVKSSEEAGTVFTVRLPRQRAGR